MVGTILAMQEFWLPTINVFLHCPETNQTIGFKKRLNITLIEFSSSSGCKYDKIFKFLSQAKKTSGKFGEVMQKIRRLERKEMIR